MTTIEAAEALGIVPQGVINAIKRGLLVAEKRGRDWYIEPAEVERYGKERRPAGGVKGRAGRKPGPQGPRKPKREV
jgi:hypothetical protein